MSTADSLARVISSLDWPGDLGWGSPETDEVDLLRSRLGDGASRWVAGAVEQSLAAVHGQIHDLLAPWSVIRAMAQHVLTATLLSLAGEDAPTADTAAISRDLTEDIVARGIPLSDMTHAMRTLQNEWLSLLIDVAVSVGPDGVGVIPAIATSVTRTMDEWIAAATDAIVDERRRVDLAEQVRVRSVIESLIAAEPVDVESSARLLRIPLIGWHLACAIGAPPGGTVERRALNGILHSFARAIGSARTVRYETSAGKVHLWVTTDDPPVVPRIEDLRVPAPVLVGVGEPHPGVGGFRRTFLEASDALGLAAALGKNRAVFYRDAALEIVLGPDDERARWFVEQELRDLAADTPEMAAMRHTLLIFFSTRMRIAPAAELLFLHRNTLIHRLERIQTLLGHSVAERSAETQAALRLAELFRRVPGDPTAGRQQFGD